MQRYIKFELSLLQEKERKIRKYKFFSFLRVTTTEYIIHILTVIKVLLNKIKYIFITPLNDTIFENFTYTLIHQNLYIKCYSYINK